MYVFCVNCIYVCLCKNIYKNERRTRCGLLGSWWVLLLVFGQARSGFVEWGYVFLLVNLLPLEGMWLLCSYVWIRRAQIPTSHHIGTQTYRSDTKYSPVFRFRQYIEDFLLYALRSIDKSHHIYFYITMGYLSVYGIFKAFWLMWI